jgi:hypothetical protein
LKIFALSYTIHYPSSLEADELIYEYQWIDQLTWQCQFGFCWESQTLSIWMSNEKSVSKGKPLSMKSYWFKSLIAFHSIICKTSN